MARYTISPWKHQSDLLTVRQQLYRLDRNGSNSGEDHRRHAVDRIMAWKLRSNLPHAVESTALLIDAQLHHLSATTNPSITISEFSIRAVYAAAFTRFVTGFCDIGRSKERGLEQSSMLAVARQIAMPVEFVALRHEATHEELPGLRRLVDAVAKGLEWLWGVYWVKLEARPAREDVEVNARMEIAKLLKAYRRERKYALQSLRQNTDDLTHQATGQCLSCCRNKREAARLVADVLVGERLLIPLNRGMGESMDGAHMLWDSMLADLNGHAPSLARALVERLVREITLIDAERPVMEQYREAHALWVLHLSQSLATDQQDLIMQQCCLHPGQWTHIIGQRVLVNGDADLRVRWEEMFAASIIDSSTDTSSSAVQPQSTEIHMTDVEMPAGVVGKWRKAIIPPTLPIGVVR